MLDWEARAAEVAATFRDSITALEGLRLREVVLQVVEPELNAVLLRFDEALYAILPWDGGALLKVDRWEEQPTELGPDSWYQTFQAAAPFHGCCVKQVRVIGDVHNGHGVEVSFAGSLDQTLVIQSSEAGDPPEELADCLRIAVTRYTYCFERDTNT